MQQTDREDAPPARLHPARARELCEALLPQLDANTFAWIDQLAERGAPPETYEALAAMHLQAGHADRALDWFARYCLAQPWARAEVPIPDEELDLIPYYEAALARAGGGPETQWLLARLQLKRGDVEGARIRLKRIAAELPPAKALLDALKTELRSSQAARPARAAEPLRALVHPLRRHRLQGWRVLLPFAQADRGDAVAARAFSEGWSEPGWVFPVLCGNRFRLVPPGHPRSDRFLFQEIPPPVLRHLRKGRGALLIDHGEEGMFTDRKDETLLAPFLGYLAENDIPAGRVVLLDANLRTPERMQAMAERAGVEPPRVLADRHLWLRFGGALRQARRAAGGADAALIQAERTVSEGVRRPKAFLSFNNAPRPHRIALVAALLERGWLDRSLVSFHGPGYARERREPGLADRDWIERAVRQCADLADLEAPQETMRELLSRSPMSVDVPLGGAGRDPWALAYSNAAWPFLDSYVSLVTDTFFSDGASAFASEKPMKAVSNLHPFIYFGDPGTLADMRARGYRTFAPLIDETYDSLADPRARMAAALAEAGRLAAMSQDELHELYCALWPTLVHNYRTLVDGAPEEAGRILEAIRAAPR